MPDRLSTWSPEEQGLTVKEEGHQLLVQVNRLLATWAPDVKLVQLDVKVGSCSARHWPISVGSHA